LTEFPLPSSYYLEALPVESARFVAAARRAGLDTGVATCPGWDVAKLIVHLGVLHRWVAQMVAGGLTERLDTRVIERAPDGDERIAWFEDGSLELVRALQDAGDDRVVWTLEGGGRSGFWFRRMAQETMVHRLDIELAAHVKGPADSLLAADGVDEYWSVQLGRKLRRQPIDGLEGVLALRATDVEAEWTVSLTRDALTLLAPGSPAEVTVSGPASELLCFVWNRHPLTTSTIQGNRSLIDVWSELVQL
jgi:uncharacterized protein (TIGR03083 family)